MVGLIGDRVRVAGMTTSGDGVPGRCAAVTIVGGAGNRRVSFSDPFGLCSKADHYTHCDDMINAAESALILNAAYASGEWRYSQGKLGDPRDYHDPRGGDCTDLVRYSVEHGIGDEWVGGSKANTTAFNSSDVNGSTLAQGFTEVDADQARPGDIVVKGGHAGVYTMTDKNGDVWGLANNGLSSDSKRGYHDYKTDATNFTAGKWSNKEVKFFRPLHNGD